MKLKLALASLLLFGIAFTFPVSAQQAELAPQPQQWIKGPDPVITDRVILRQISGLDDDAVRLINETLPVFPTGKGLPLTLLIKKGPTLEMKRSGAYTLTVNGKGIRIEAADARGLYYAAQTLSGLVTRLPDGKVSIMSGSVKDYPDVMYRGIVEGFYGEPWSFDDRIEQLRFYGKLKLNTYIYGPKDDPYHSSPNWREPYPENEAAQIRALVDEANRNKVDFVWAIHPGKDIQWNHQDSLAILHKFDLMYDLGVRAFAVFFDDIAGEGTKPEKQAGLLNYIHDEFIAKKGDVHPLIMCPTEYNKAWSNQKPGTYLDILGEQLHSGIQIMWTGNSVISDITKEGLDWVNNRLKRPAYVWWNFPVSDYVRDHLLMGPAYGLDKGIENDMSGFVTNPMDKAEASKVAIYGVALYAWNMESYDPQKAWEQACAYVMPEAPMAFLTFCEHNSDPGFNYHRYRRDESAGIKPVADQFLATYKDGRFDGEQAVKLQQTFSNIKASPAVMREKSPNKRLLEQLDPWMRQFELLGKAGSTALDMAKVLSENSAAQGWNYYLEACDVLDSMERIDATMNQNPYQPGVKTGSKVLKPFVDGLVQESACKLLSSSENEGGEVTAIAALYTDQEQLMNMPAREKKNSIGYTPVFEVIRLQPGQYIGVRWEMQKEAKQFDFHLPNSNADWRAVEWSADGKSWTPIDSIPVKAVKVKIDRIDPTARYIRMRNGSDQVQQIYLSEFSVTTRDAEKVDESLKMYDKNLNTAYLLNAGESIEVPCNENRQIALFTSGKKGGCVVCVEVMNEQGEYSSAYLGAPGYIELNGPVLSGIKSVRITPCGQQPLSVHQIVKR